MAKIMDPILPIYIYTLCFEILGHCFGFFWRSRYIYLYIYIYIYMHVYTRHIYIYNKYVEVTVYTTIRKGYIFLGTRPVPKGSLHISRNIW